MKHFTLKSRIVSVFFAAIVILSSCSSITLIDSYPSGADLYLNGEAVGETPYEMMDTKPSFSCTSVRIEKEGHKTFYTNICKDEEVDVGAVVGGIFCTIPFIWTFKYKPTHFYRLREVEGDKEDVNSEFENLINENHKESSDDK